LAENGVVTVLVGRFDPLIGLGLAGILRSDRRISVLASGLEWGVFEREVSRRLPQVAIVDEAVEPVLGRLRASRPAMGLVVLADKPSSEYGTRLLTAGATCVSRSATVAEILAAVHFTAQGGRVFTPVDPSATPELTARQAEILSCIRAKRTNAEIADELHISVETVKSHVASVRRKLNAKSKREC
jgi:DNA-binding NarL/FixJ family response regulator